MRTLVSFAMVFILLAFARAGRADVLPPQKGTCPDGAKIRMSHEGQACVPTTCFLDSECTNGKVCKEHSLCIEKRRTASGTDEIADTSCPKDGTCAYPAACRTENRCVEGSIVQRFRSSCGCSVVGDAPEHGGALLGLTLAALAILAARGHARAVKSPRAAALLPVRCDRGGSGAARPSPDPNSRCASRADP